MTQLLTPEQAAQKLQVCIKTLQQCRRLGLKSVRVTTKSIRYREDDLENYIEEMTEEQCPSNRKNPNTTTTASRLEVLDFKELVKR